MKPEEDYDGLFGEGSLGKLQERHYINLVGLALFNLIYDLTTLVQT